jgi:hypothetical protein
VEKARRIPRASAALEYIFMEFLLWNPKGGKRVKSRRQERRFTGRKINNGKKKADCPEDRMIVDW